MPLHFVSAPHRKTARHPRNSQPGLNKQCFAFKNKQEPAQTNAALGEGNDFDRVLALDGPQEPEQAPGILLPAQAGTHNCNSGSWVLVISLKTIIQKYS